MTNSLANSFGLVFLFGVFLILFCLESQDNVTMVVMPRRWIETTPPDSLNGDRRATEGSETPWPYDTPILQGWEPEKTRNLSVYLQPDVNTTLIMPRFIFNFDVMLFR